MQFLPPCPQQGAIRRILHQRVLKQIGGLRRKPPAEQKPGFREPVEASPQLDGGPLRHLLNQIVAEFAAKHRADLPDLLGERPEPIEARDQGGVQCGGDRQLRKRTCRQDRGDPVVRIAAFEHGLGQLFDEQWHAVGTLDDLVDDVVR
jgi:hypothetical protein